MPDPHPHLTLFFGVWAAVGPLAGILVGHVLTRSWDKKRWLLDCRKQEFKELVTALSAEVAAMIQYQDAPRDSRGPIHQSHERLQKLREAHATAFNVISDRLYIANDVQELDVSHRFQDQMQKLRESGNNPAAISEIEALMNAIIKRALKG
jgi:hypothetical protein